MARSGRRLRQAQRVLVWVMVANAAVAAAKVLYGGWTDSASMTADGFHSVSDSASNVVGLIGLGLAARPRDAHHPYGHKKFESFTAVIIGLVLFGLALRVFGGALQQFFLGRAVIPPQVTSWSFGIMLLTMMVNALVMRYERRSGRLLQSEVLIADAMHPRSDLLVSASVIGTLLSVRAGFPILDTVVAMAIAVLIAVTAYEIVQPNFAALCDRTVFSPAQISQIVRAIPEVRSCHQARTRGRRDDVHVDLHVAVDGHMPVGRAHQLSHTIEQRLKQELPGISDVIVHIEPANEGSSDAA